MVGYEKVCEISIFQLINAKKLYLILRFGNLYGFGINIQ